MGDFVTLATLQNLGVWGGGEKNPLFLAKLSFGWFSHFGYITKLGETKKKNPKTLKPQNPKTLLQLVMLSSQECIKKT